MAQQSGEKDNFNIVGPSGIEYVIQRRSAPVLTMLLKVSDMGTKELKDAKDHPLDMIDQLIHAIVVSVGHPKIIFKDNELFFKDAIDVRVPPDDQNLLFTEVAKLLRGPKTEAESVEVVETFLGQ